MANMFSRVGNQVNEQLKMGMENSDRRDYIKLSTGFHIYSQFLQ
jgi:hypothetical protein